MRNRRKTRSFQGLVRERLEDIERDRARGIPQATILAQLGSIGTTIGTFRDALYRARRRARADLSSPQRGQAVVQFAISTQILERDSPNSVPVPSTVTALASSEKVRTTPSQPVSSPPLRSHRDFMALARSIPDKDIF